MIERRERLRAINIRDALSGGVIALRIYDYHHFDGI